MRAAGSTRRALVAAAAGGALSACAPAAVAEVAPRPWLHQVGPRLRDRIGAGLQPWATIGPRRAAELGFGFARVGLMWDWIELERGAYDFTNADIAYHDMHRRGVRPLIIINPVNTRYNGPDALGASADEIDALQRFCAVAARRYRGLRPLWEIFNEPNHPQFWKPRPDPGAYVRMAQAAIAGLREGDRDAVAVIGALSGVHAEARGFLRACLDLGLGQQADAVSVHPYLETPEDALPEYAALRALLRGYPGRRGPLGVIQSEWGVPSHVVAAPLYQQRVARIMLTDAHAGLAGSLYYKLLDEAPDNPDEYERHYGVLRHDGSAKAGALLTARLLAAIGDAETVRPLAAPPGAFVLAGAVAGREVLIGWTREAPQTITLNGARVLLKPTPQILT